ncbi:MAG: class I SAM-dependent methyltransferase [Bacteroidales bacterium]|nr:class I SAM-dependent methyltransferase [Bacteroidales bacterium]
MYNHLSINRGDFPVQFNPSKTWYKQVRIIQSLLGKKPSSVLDVGCRTGDFLMHFDATVHCEGVELSKSFTEIANKRGLTIHNDFLENIEFDKKYDVISSFAILEHLKDPSQFLEKINSITKPSGLVVILVPTYESIKRKVIDFSGSSWHMYSPPEHLNFFSRKFLDQYFAGKGFKLVYRYYTSGGMTNIFPNLPFINKLLKKSVNLLDNSIFSKLAIFDHMYSYYQFKPSSNQVKF